MQKGSDIEKSAASLFGSHYCRTIGGWADATFMQEVNHSV